MSDPTSDQVVWFLTGSQGLYGEDVLGQVADQSRTISDALDRSGDIPLRVVAKPVLTDAAAIRRVMRDADGDDDCVGVIAWMRTFSPAKMWIGGLAVLHKPLLHLHTQVNERLPWATIDMDFMNLKSGRPRRPGVRLHPDPARGATQDSRRSCLGPVPGTADRAYHRLARGLA